MASIDSPQINTPLTYRAQLQRFCNEGWEDLTHSLEGSRCHRLGQIVKKIVLFIPLIFATFVEFLWKQFDRFTQRNIVVHSPRSNNPEPESRPSPVQNSLSPISLGPDLPEYVPSWKETDQKRLEEFALEGDIQRIHTFFRSRIDIPNKPRYFSWLAISKACDRGRFDAIYALLEYEPRIRNTPDLSILNTFVYERTSFLHEAINVPPYFITPSNKILAPSFLRLLLENNADIELRNKSGETPLEKIIGSSHTPAIMNESRLEAVQILLGHVTKLHKKKIREILNHVAPCLLKDLIGITSEYLGPYECPDYVNMSQPGGQTPIFQAAYRRHSMLQVEDAELSTNSIALANLLLEAGASPLARNQHSTTDPIKNIDSWLSISPLADSEKPTNEIIKQILLKAQTEWKGTERQAVFEARWQQTNEARGWPSPEPRFYSDPVVLRDARDEDLSQFVVLEKR